MTTALQLTYATLPLLLFFSREGEAVTVLSVGLQSGDATLPLHSDKNATLECRFRLDDGERVEELLWVREGKLLRSSNEEQETGIEVSDLYTVDQDRNAKGIYSCTVVTTQGAKATGKFELFVIDILKNAYSSSVNTANCSYVISYGTPYAYPRGSAYCGIWVPDSAGGNGTWFAEYPPENGRPAVMSVSGPVSSSASKLSYSSDRGEFDEAIDSEGRVRFSLEKKKIWVMETPRNSSIKCTFGFYSTTGRFYSQAAFESTSYTHLENTNTCLEKTPKKFITQGVSLKFSAYTHDCYDRIYSTFGTDDLTATLRCDKSNELEVLVCVDNVWQLRVKHDLVKEYDDFLEEFVESCEDSSDDGGSTAALSGALGAVSLLVSLRRLHAL